MEDDARTKTDDDKLCYSMIWDTEGGFKIVFVLQKFKKYTSWN